MTNTKCIRKSDLRNNKQATLTFNSKCCTAFYSKSNFIASALAGVIGTVMNTI